MRILNFRNIYVFLAILYVILCNLVFIGHTNFKPLIIYTIIVFAICILMRIWYGISRIMFILFFWIYFIIVLTSFGWEIFSTGQFQHHVAGYITIGFMTLLGILGTGAIEIILLFIGSIALLAGGIWLSRTQPNFDFYLTCSLLVGIILLILSVLRIGIFNAREIGRNRFEKYKVTTPIKGNFTNFNTIAAISYIFIMALCLSVILFTVMPRPNFSSKEPPKSASDEFIPENDFDPDNFPLWDKNEEYPTAFDEETVKNQRTRAPEETTEINPRYSFLSSLLNKQPRFYVNFSKLGQPGKRFENDDFYTKVKVFDVYNGEKWLVSEQNEKAWSKSRKTEYTLPLMYEILEGANKTRGGILSNVVFSSDFDSNKIIALYQLIQDQIYPQLFMPDFPLRVYAHSFKMNDNTGELISETAKQLQYNIESFHVKYDRLKALVCTRGKGKSEKNWLSIGKFDADLYELAMQIIEESKINKEFTEFTADEYTDHDVIRAVIRFLKEGDSANKFIYEIAPPKVPSNENPLKFFLFKSKIGNCTQFNTAAAILLRYLGLPTRIIAGYRGGKWINEEFRYEVQYLRAHLWFEVYFKDFGWYRFDATPDWERDEKISQVENDVYQFPKYFNKYVPSTNEDTKKNVDEKKPDKTDENAADTVETLESDESDDKKTGEIFGKFLTEYDNDEMIVEFVKFLEYVFSSGIRSLLFFVMLLLIPAILYRSWILRKIKLMLGIFNNDESDSDARDSRKSRKSRIIENKLVSDFRDLERLFKKFGYVRSPSETWIEFNKRLDGFSNLVSTMLNSLIFSYYYARFGMQYSEFKDFKIKLGTLKKHLQKQLSTIEQ